MEAPDLTDAEKAAIHYADLAASNHLANHDETLATFESTTPRGNCRARMYWPTASDRRMAAKYRIIEELPEASGYDDEASRRGGPYGETRYPGLSKGGQTPFCRDV